MEISKVHCIDDCVRKKEPRSKVEELENALGMEGFDVKEKCCERGPL